MLRIDKGIGNVSEQLARVESYLWNNTHRWNIGHSDSFSGLKVIRELRGGEHAGSS